MLLFNLHDAWGWGTRRIVSILVLLDVALQLISFPSVGEHSSVSILVLLDVALQPFYTVPLCSYVIVSILVLLDVALQRSWRWKMRLRSLWFQSLFYWMLLFNNWRYLWVLWEYFMFQSLFYWMLLFNQCAVFPPHRTYFLFQSLFYWMLLFNRCEKWWSGLKLIRFNPCFTGCCSSTAHFLVQILSYLHSSICFFT